MSKYYCFNRNSDYKDRIDSIIQCKKREIFDFFNVSDVDLDFKIYIYDSRDDLVLGMRERGFSNMPSYMCACFKDEDNSLNFYEPKDVCLDDWCKDEYDYVIFHELIHGIQSKIYGEKPEWLCEGIAKYLDGTYKCGIKSLLEKYIHNGKVPPMSELENNFGFCEYDSYDYAFLIVSYLIDTLGKDNFLNVIKKEDNFSNNLVTNAIRYYNKKYFDDEFYNGDLNNPNWLFHGSPVALDSVEKRKSHDSLGVEENIDTAVFLTSSVAIASCYAFKDSIKKNSRDLEWDFSISSFEEFPIMTMKNVVIDENLEGYIYVFSNDGNFVNEPEGSLQFKSYNNLNPVAVKKIIYKDFSPLYKVETKIK